MKDLPYWPEDFRRWETESEIEARWARDDEAQRIDMRENLERWAECDLTELLEKYSDVEAVKRVCNKMLERCK
jgi:hypothetical protein